MRPLSRELITQYDISVKKYQYIRSNYYLETSKGKFVLRKVDLPKEQILFDYEVDCHLREHNFAELSPICLTKKELPYSIIGEQYYIMQQYEAYEETDFKNYEDLYYTLTVLAHFHKEARQVNSHIKDVEQIKIKNIYEYYMRRKTENARLKRKILRYKQKSKFEMIFLEHYESYRLLEEEALESINNELAEALIREVRMERCVAHKDYTYHTINKTQDKRYKLSQIDYCNYDIQILDVSQILNKIMQKNEWNYTLLYDLIEAYNNVRTLSNEEYQLLRFMLIYPQKYNNICLKYTGSRRRWNYSMFEQKWEHMLDYKENQMEAIKKLKEW